MKTFYWYFRPIAVTLKIFGVFPIQNVTNLDTEHLHFRVFSYSSFYSLLVFCLYCYMVYYFSGFIFIISLEATHLKYVVFIMTTRSALSFFFCYRKYRELPKLIRLLDTFDQRKQGILATSTRKGELFRTILANIIVMTCLGFSSYESSELIKEMLPDIIKESRTASLASIFFGILAIWQFYPFFLYMYFALKISYNYQEINNTLIQRNFKHDYFNTGVVKYDSDMYHTLSRIRVLHNMVSESVQELGKCYGSFIATDHLCVIIVFVLNFSVFMSQKQLDCHLLFLTLGNAGIVMNTILKSDELKEKGADVINLLHGIPSTAICEKSQAEINMFLLQLIARPVQVDAAGYFILDKRHTLAILSAVATYVIVAIEFQQDTMSDCLFNSTSL